MQLLEKAATIIGGTKDIAFGGAKASVGSGGLPMPLLRPLVAVMALLLGASLVGSAPAAADTKKNVVTITHAPLTATSVTGTGLGTVRTFYVATSVTGRKAPSTGYLSGTLTTIATGLADAKEARAANLVFVVGSEPNQLVVGGLSLYATEGSTLAAGATTIRPIIGGSGIYSGARGSVESTNLGDQGWRHVFRLVK